MSIVTLSPAGLAGTVTLPPSKSAAHRAILCAALSRGVSEIDNISLSKDISATLGAVEALGVRTRLEGGRLTVDGRGLFSQREVAIDCGESGSTLRFLIPVAAAGGQTATFTGRGRLPERPIGIYLDCLPPQGVVCATRGGLPLRISGQLRPGVFSMPGNVSSQFVTGLLLALPLLPGDSDIWLTSPLESLGYVEMTLEQLERFGVGIQRTERGYHVPGNQRYRPQRLSVEGDWSQAAFFMAAAAMGAQPLTLRGLLLPSSQGDSAAVTLFERFGARIERGHGEITVHPGALKGIEIDASQIPDLVPILAVAGALAQGVTRIYGAARLRIKESDRLAAIADGLNRLGAQVRELPDGLVIQGVPALEGGRAEGCNDHRIVMALSIAALRAWGPVEITDAQSIEKSYPAFFEDYNSLGGHAHVIHLG